MKHLLLIPILLCAACVMPSDIHQLRANFEDFESGAVTKPEFDQKNRDIIAEMDRRNAELKNEASDIPTDPGSLIAYLLGIGGTVASSVLATNKVRDKRRKLLHEPTINDPAPKA